MSAARRNKIVVHDRIARVERMLPGYKVVAGPYNIDSPHYSTRQRESAECLKVKQDQLKAKVDCKVLLLKDGAWVLRDGAGWQEGNEVRSLTLAEIGGRAVEGLRCPLCRKGPFMVKGLKVHRCTELPTLKMGGRVFHQRLSPEVIEQAIQKGKA